MKKLCEPSHSSDYCESVVSEPRNFSVDKMNALYLNNLSWPIPSKMRDIVRLYGRQSGQKIRTTNQYAQFGNSSKVPLRVAYRLALKFLAK